MEGASELIIMKESIPVRAWCLGERIDLKGIGGERVSPVSVAVRIGVGRAIVFRHGVVVAFGTTADDESRFLQTLAVSDPVATVESEDVTLRISGTGDEGPKDDTIELAGFDLPRFEVVADVLGKSVALSRYESRMTEVFRDIEPLAIELRAGGRRRPGQRDLVRQIGASLLMELTMVGRVEVDEKPEILWERADLERLHARLAEEFELRDRHRALERKLELATRTAKTLLDLLQNDRSLRVEWYILVVIVIELALMAYEVRGHFF